MTIVTSMAASDAKQEPCGCRANQRTPVTTTRSGRVEPRTRSSPWRAIRGRRQSIPKSPEADAHEDIEKGPDDRERQRRRSPRWLGKGGVPGRDLRSRRQRFQYSHADAHRQTQDQTRYRLRFHVAILVGEIRFQGPRYCNQLGVVQVRRLDKYPEISVSTRDQKRPVTS
jgi:hypothetical protein